MAGAYVPCWTVCLKPHPSYCHTADTFTILGTHKALLGCDAPRLRPLSLGLGHGCCWASDSLCPATGCMILVACYCPFGASEFSTHSGWQ